MTEERPNLLSVLGIARARSLSGGISLRDALRLTNYRELRHSFEPNDLIPLIRANPKLVDQWLRYSEDKRTDEGWYLAAPNEIGEPASKRRIVFPSLYAAVANFIVLELDFWARIPETISTERTAAG
jgi:hypothetical protein